MRIVIDAMGGDFAPLAPVQGALLARERCPDVELARRLEGKAPLDFPRETAIGALGLYVSDGSVADFQPMNINFGIIPPLGYRVKGKRNKNAALSARSLALIDALRGEALSDVEEI